MQEHNVPIADVWSSVEIKSAEFTQILAKMTTELAEYLKPSNFIIAQVSDAMLYLPT